MDSHLHTASTKGLQMLYKLFVLLGAHIHQDTLSRDPSRIYKLDSFSPLSTGFLLSRSSSPSRGRLPCPEVCFTHPLAPCHEWAHLCSLSLIPGNSSPMLHCQSRLGNPVEPDGIVHAQLPWLPEQRNLFCNVSSLSEK